MSVSREYRAFVLDQLRAVVPVTAKSMFGGVGIYSGDTFFALIADDTLYFKVDAVTQPEFESAGCRAFDPFGKGPMSYFEVPAGILESEDDLRLWTRRSIAIAKREKRR